ncbi:MAG TPA: alpha/beta hydrolase, partial [Anaerolineae bacterium]|nr:alpha/beta hydrolase [Anaerolineae bacterium]
ARLINLILLSAIVLAACATPTPVATPSPTAPPDAPRFETAECWFDEPQGQTVECGYLVVPEDRAQPGDKTIKLAVARFKSDSSRPEPDPIVYLEGGPGGSPLRSFTNVFNILFAPLLEKRDVILFDQRGTGYSQPALDCPEYKDWALSVLDEDLTAEESERLGNQELIKCRDRLAQQGVNLAVFNSAENAADLNDLRLALGHDQVNLYGISYGTRLALTAMRDFPQGIRSVVIDSVVPLQSNLYTETPANGARAFDVLFQACQADAACRAAYPNLRDVFFDLVKQLNARPATFSMKLKSGQTVKALLNGDGMMSLMFQSLYATSLIPYLPGLVYQVRDGNYALAGALQSEFLDQLEDISYGMHYSVQCDEEVPFGTPDEIAAAIRQNPDFAMLASQRVFDLCQAWGLPTPNPVENKPVSSDIPTLVLSGEFDPITPPAWGRLVAQTLSRSVYVELPNSGHGGSLTGGECARGIVLAFLDDPAGEPDTACIQADLSELVFSIPLKASELKLTPFSESSMGISGVVPEGWKPVGPGAYTPGGSLTEQTALLQQAAPIQPDVFLRLMTGQIEQSGIQAEFEKTGTRTANDLDWTLYTTEASIAVVDLALAEQSGTTFIVLMQSVVGERETLYEALFLPAVDALRPGQ